MTALFGWYDPSNFRTMTASFVFNVLLLLGTWDFIWRGEILYSSESLSFSRVGYTDSSSTRILLRSPNAEVVEVSWRNWETSPWISSVLTGITAEEDFTATITIGDLVADTKYEYMTNASHRGSFQTLKSDQKVFTIISSSCIKPFFPYNPLDHPLRIIGLEHLSKYALRRSIDFMLFLGDFIYIDLPTNFGWTGDHYFKAYRQIYASPSWTAELFNLPFIHMYDDHEIINDWASNETGLYKEAIQPFLAYHHHANPTTIREGATHFVFSRGDVSFFVMDNRRYRSGLHVHERERTMLGREQLDDLQQWLRTEKRWKVLVSGVPFTRNWRNCSDEGDSWGGYLVERQSLLETMWNTEGVIIVSGDRHEHATTIFPSPQGKNNVIEFSTSPLSQFYQPFERSYQQVEDTDVEIFSYSHGVSKFGVMTFNTTDPTSLTLEFDLIVNGVNIWQYNWRLNR